MRYSDFKIVETKLDEIPDDGNAAGQEPNLPVPVELEAGPPYPSEDTDAVKDMQSKLEELRQDIDEIDDELLNLLSNRMKVAREIGIYKKDNNMTILQQKRWNDIVEKTKKKAEKNQLSVDFVQRFISAIHDESINQQEKILKS